MDRTEPSVTRIRDFEATSQDYEAFARIRNAVWPEETSTVDDLRGEDRERPPTLAHHRFQAEIAGQAVGYGSFEHHEKFYHPRHFWLRLDVLPDHRQRGIGGQLYDHLLARLQSEWDASELHASTTERRDDSLRFLTKRGFQADKREPISRLSVATFDWTRFPQSDARLADMKIEIRVLSDLMQGDADVLPELYELHQRLVNDVPEPAEHTRVDFARWRDGYAANNPYFIPEANFIALHDGACVGLASLWGQVSSDTLFAGLTGVMPGYRRNGIATALKLRAIAFAQAHDTAWITTSNNSENPMYQLNCALGFETMDTRIKYVKSLGV